MVAYWKDCALSAPSWAGPVMIASSFPGALDRLPQIRREKIQGPQDSWVVMHRGLSFARLDFEESLIAQEFLLTASVERGGTSEGRKYCGVPALG